MSAILAAFGPIVKLLLDALLPLVLEKANDTAEDSGTAAGVRERLRKRVLHKDRLCPKRYSSTVTPNTEEG